MYGPLLETVNVAEERARESDHIILMAIVQREAVR